MELVLIAVGLFVLFALIGVFSRPRRQHSGATKSVYAYNARDYIMTKYESRLFRRLESLLTDKYYVFPQVHLDRILDHQIKGQNWRSARAKISQKSIDFALVDRESLQTICLIELDDKSHDETGRQERDAFVDTTLDGAGVRIAHLRNIGNMDDQTLLAAIEPKLA